MGYKEAFIQDNKLCLVMEFVGEGDLSEKIAKAIDNDEVIDEETIWTPLIGTISVLGDITGSL